MFSAPLDKLVSPFVSVYIKATVSVNRRGNANQAFCVTKFCIIARLRLLPPIKVTNCSPLESELLGLKAAKHDDIK